MSDDENVMKPQTPAATLMPVQTCEEEDNARITTWEKALLLRVYHQMFIKNSSNKPRT